MSRVILSKYPSGEECVVVGWDHPAGGAFWQEWASRQEIALAERRLADDLELDPEDERALERVVDTGVKREGGMFPGIALANLALSMPEELRPLITVKVLGLLADHAADPDSGYNAKVIDLSRAR